MARPPANEAPYRLLRDVELGEDVVIQSFTNLYGCRIGDGTRIGPFVEIQGGGEVGARCKIQSHSFVCSGVTIGDEVFVGHGVLFINDKRPRATTAHGELQTEEDWELLRTVVERGRRWAPAASCSAACGSARARSSAPARWWPRRRSWRGRRHAPLYAAAAG